MGRVFCRVLAVACVLVAGMPAWAQGDFPNRPVRVVVGFAPGGTTDIVARLIAQQLTEIWGQQVIVDNRPGASAMIGAALVAQSPPDGYTLFQNSNSHVVAPMLTHSAKYDAIKDFTMISKVMITPNIILVNSTSPMKTVADLITYAKAHPSALSYGNPGQGSITHLSGELFKTMTNIDIVAVPFKGGALSVQSLVSNEIPMTFNTLPEVMGQIKSGSVRPIAVTTAKRSPALPDVPTIGETVKDYDVGIWQGWMGPAGMPAPLVEKIHAGIAKAMESPVLRQRFAEVAAEPAATKPADFTAEMIAEQSKWRPVVQTAGIKMD
jgi:tripartite-type tricarboxylate transporter receptor subunit TctC